VNTLLGPETTGTPGLGVGVSDRSSGGIYRRLFWLGLVCLCWVGLFVV